MKNSTMVAKSTSSLFFLIPLLLLPLKGIGQDTSYWQQRVDTKIKVSLDDVRHVLDGDITMQYTNNSPDTLNYIFLHLYANAFKTDRTAYEKQAVENGNTEHYFSTDEERGYIDSMDFTVDGSSAELKILQEIDEAKLVLPHPLLPGQTITISSPFRVKLPKIFSRMGHNGQAYQISQWYPKPAVYDQTGWHEFPYLDQGEFYSEFGTYDVFITLPKNYIVMATGQLENAPQEEKWLDSLAALPLPSDTLYKNSFPVSSNQLKTLHFHAEKVHDFAWFADKRWIVRKDTLTGIYGRSIPVTAYRCFLPRHERGWATSKKAVASAIKGYSYSVGAYPYPYNTVKVVDGALMSSAGGMEYPTIAVIASANAPSFVNTDIVHEIGHNWFYAILATNERDFPWMDEGINSFYEHRYSSDSFALGGHSINFLAYGLLSAIRQLQPADTTSTVYTNINYGIDIYEKVPLFLEWLESYMDQVKFQYAMQDYYKTWQFKHPQPADFKTIFERHTQKDISWFFKALSDDRPVDFAIKSVKRYQDSIVVHLKNKTGLIGPVLIDFRGKNKNGDILEHQVWSEPFSDRSTVVLKTKTVPEADWGDISIDRVVPDFNESNNASRKPLAIRLLVGMNFGHRHKMWIAPAIGKNYYDGFMVGLAFHDLTIPQNRFQFGLVPLFGTGSNKFIGTGFMSETWYFHKGWLKDLETNLEGKSFDYQKSDLNIDHYELAGYQKISPELVLNIRKPYPRSPINRRLILKGYWIKEGSLAFNMNPEDSLYRPEKGPSETYLYAKLRYEYKNERTFNPFGYAFEGQLGNDFAKLSVSAHLRADYYLKNKGLYLRGYLGKLINLSETSAIDRRYSLSSAYTSDRDYLYDGTFLARYRNTGFFANQVAIKEGGFKMNTLQYANPVGLSNNWLAALNLKTDLPFGWFPLRIFGDLAAFPKAGSNQAGVDVIYEAGLSLHIGKVVAFYMPLVMSKELNDYAKSVLGDNRVLKSISFTVNLSAIPWTKLSQLALKLQ